jgi:hypothetical protein
VVWHRGARFDSLEALVAFMVRVLTEVEGQAGAE